MNPSYAVKVPSVSAPDAKRKLEFGPPAPIFAVHVSFAEPLTFLSGTPKSASVEKLVGVLRMVGEERRWI
jgi:hypothetical protein